MIDSCLSLIHFRTISQPIRIQWRHNPGFSFYGRKIRLIECNAKCHHLKNWPVKGLCGRCLFVKGKGGRWEGCTRDKVLGSNSSKHWVEKNTNMPDCISSLQTLINICQKVPLYVNFCRWRHFALVSNIVNLSMGLAYPDTQRLERLLFYAHCTFAYTLGFWMTCRRASYRRRGGRRRWEGWRWSRPPGPGWTRNWAASQRWTAGRVWTRSGTAFASSWMLQGNIKIRMS